MSPARYGPSVVSLVAVETSAAASAVPPLPALSVPFAGSGSCSAAVAVARLSNAPAWSMVAVTSMVAPAPEATVGIVHGRAVQPAPVTPVMVRFVGVSVTSTWVAADGPALATWIV